METLQLEELSSNLAEAMMPDNDTSPQITNMRVQKFVNTLHPILKQKLGVDLKKPSPWNQNKIQQKNRNNLLRN